ncbi:coiled-coil domain-containing protein [Williamsia sterculiae]|uniref:DivIVA protein n=1 Tax=Williamsia sterculiae TaxID=1344003 RepID=A0A1N7HFP1_9NOCA|nr:hypothetical protein [Williamsia sterculiae]SIS23662.1 hypothetical protein SAMN05445060_4142 [Williamsia sterculiae]
MPSDPSRPVGTHFPIVMRGYDREQVNDWYKRVDADLRVMAADRDAAAANARELADHLEDARDEIEALRREVDKLSVPPTTAQGMSERISRMLQLASDEVSESRAQAAAEAAETVSIARQEAEQTRADADSAARELIEDAERRAAESDADLARREEEMTSRRAQFDHELEERRTAFESEHTAAMQAAREEAARILERARVQAEEDDLRAQQNRDRIQEDFDVTIAARREKVAAEVHELETSSRDTARELIEQAQARADRTRRHAESTATEHLTRARETVESTHQLRRRMLAQLAEVRGQLDQIPDFLRELDDDAARIETETAEAINAGQRDDTGRAPSAETESDSDTDEATTAQHTRGPRSRTAISYR